MGKSKQPDQIEEKMASLEAEVVRLQHLNDDDKAAMTLLKAEVIRLQRLSDHNKVVVEQLQSEKMRLQAEMMETQKIHKARIVEAKENEYKKLAEIKRLQEEVESLHKNLMS